MLAGARTIQPALPPPVPPTLLRRQLSLHRPVPLLLQTAARCLPGMGLQQQGRLLRQHLSPGLVRIQLQRLVGKEVAAAQAAAAGEQQQQAGLLSGRAALRVGEQEGGAGRASANRRGGGGRGS